MKFTTNPQTQLEIEILTGLLSGLGPEQLLSYEEMSAALGFPVKSKHWVLLRARDRVEEDTGLRFATVTGEGVKKLAAEHLPGIGMAARSRIGRLAKRTGVRLTRLRYNDIDRRLRQRIDAERSLACAIGAVASTQGNHVAKLTRTGPIVAAAVFDYISPPHEPEAEQA